MHLVKEFDVKQARAAAFEKVARDETLMTLFPDTRTEIVEREGNRRTVCSHYRALGQEGAATFHLSTASAEAKAINQAGPLVKVSTPSWIMTAAISATAVTLTASKKDAITGF